MRSSSAWTTAQKTTQARVISARLHDTWVINTYMPQGQEVGTEAFAYKLAYFQRLRDWLDARFKPDEKLVWTGDINVAPTDLDVFDPKRMAGKLGCHPDERAALEKVASWGLSDMFRRFSPGGEAIHLLGTTACPSRFSATWAGA